MNRCLWKDKEVIESLKSVSVGDVKIKNPNNPVQLMDGKILVFRISNIKG
jgi:hypothetical protein